MKPPRSILSKDFVYTCADKTDVSKLFERIRHEQKIAAETRKAQDAQAATRVTPLRQRST
jgi:hypothetical protein